MPDHADGGLGAHVEHPIEEWTDQELLDQLVYVRAEFADMEAGQDDTASPMAEIEAEIVSRGLGIPEGADLATPGRQAQDPSGDPQR
ncbi:MAG: hypothetical protein ACFCVC_03895 [Acidimicrobiia bacterium]